MKKKFGYVTLSVWALLICALVLGPTESSLGSVLPAWTGIVLIAVFIGAPFVGCYLVDEGIKDEKKKKKDEYFVIRGGDGRAYVGKK